MFVYIFFFSFFFFFFWLLLVWIAVPRPGAPRDVIMPNGRCLGILCVSRQFFVSAGAVRTADLAVMSAGNPHSRLDIHQAAMAIIPSPEG